MKGGVTINELENMTVSRIQTLYKSLMDYNKAREEQERKIQEEQEAQQKKQKNGNNTNTSNLVNDISAIVSAQDELEDILDGG